MQTLLPNLGVKMRANTYEIYRKECLKNKSCKTCYCSNKNICFAKLLEEKVSDFPSIEFSKLNEIEQKRVLRTKAYPLIDYVDLVVK